jgi:curved DNA-binding protein CbpA
MSAFARVAVPARTRPVPASVPVLGRHDPRRSSRGVDASVATVSGRRALPRVPRRASVVARAASSSGAPGGKDLYELLNVSTTATPKEIKSAYKKAALKYHPDVNKAPDAAERFNEVKSAYQTLSDPDARRRYDLLRAGGGARARPSDPFSSGFGASARARSGPGPGPTPGAGRASARPQDEPFYGFSDFWRDMEKEFEAFEKSRPDPGKPRTLWEELGALGEEFVDFLEESAFEAASTTKDPFTGETTTKRTSYSSSSSEGKDGNGGSRSSTYSSTTTTSRSYSTSSGSGGAGSGGAGRAPPKRESVDEMLEKMKRDMGLK